MRGDETDPPIMAPIALVNNHHCRGTVEYVYEVGVALVDKKRSTERCGHRRVSALTPWALANPWGQGLLSGFALEVAELDARGLEDADKPDVVVKSVGAAPDADHIAAELDLCVALAG